MHNPVRIDVSDWLTSIKHLIFKIIKLWISLKNFQTKPYDAKKSCWIPDEKEGFVEGEIKSAKGDQVTVAFGNKVLSLVSFFVVQCRFNKRLNGWHQKIINLKITTHLDIYEILIKGKKYLFHGQVFLDHRLK